MLAPSRLPSARNAHTRRRSASPGSDVKFHTAFDERWRQIATFREDDALPKEQFVYHCAGAGGYGGSSYIDSVLLRDRDITNGWTGAADGTLEERIYLLQNWRADVVVIVDDVGEVQESAHYSAYGVPFGRPKGDADGDGDCDTDDLALVTQWIANTTYSACGDFNLDGVLDAKDETVATDNDGAVHGRGVLSDAVFGNRKGYAGYEGDAKLSAKWHVRHRVLDSLLGKWLERDPIRYAAGMNMGEYARTSPSVWVDPMGLDGEPCIPDWVAPRVPVKGWIVHMKMVRKVAGACGRRPCRYHVIAGVGWLDSDGNIRHATEQNKGAQWEDWHAHAPAAERGRDYPHDMDMSSETGDVDPDGDAPRDESGRKEEKFGKKSGDLVGSHPQGVFAVACGSVRRIHIQFDSPLDLPMRAPSGQGGTERNISIEMNLYLICRGCGKLGRNSDTVPVPPGGTGGPSSPGSGCPGDPIGPKSGGGDTPPPGGSGGAGGPWTPGGGW